MEKRNMKIITIGRSSTNNIKINDSKVSRIHCQIIQEDDNSVTLMDLNSTNGTYVNEKGISGKINLNKGDVVRIGDTIIPWQNYVSQNTGSGYVDIVSSKVSKIQQVLGGKNSILGMIALVLSLIGIILLIYAFIRILRWGIFAAIFGSAITHMWVSVGINIIAYILATIDEYRDYAYSEESDSNVDLAGIAKNIASIGVFFVIGFYIYVRLAS